MEEELQPEFVETSLSESTVEDPDITMPDNKPFLGYIYKIEFPNGKHYIGLTKTSLEQRTKEHKILAKMDDLRILYKAMRKYNMIDTFKLIEIDTATTYEELRKKEIEYIQTYKSHYASGYGYNMTLGGEGILGYNHTEETRQTISEIMKKRYENPLAIQKNINAQKQHYIDHPEARVKNSEAQKKYNREHPEAGKIQSKRMKQYYDNPERVIEQSERLKKYYETHPEAIERQSLISKQRWESQEKRQKMSEKKKQYYRENESSRRKIADGQGSNKPFDIFTKDGTLIGTFTYQFEAQEYLQKEYDISSRIMISGVLSGKNKSSAGFVFKYKTI